MATTLPPDQRPPQPKINWHRGVLRLYLALAIAGWFGYWLVYVPMEDARWEHELAQHLIEQGKTEDAEAFRHANYFKSLLYVLRSGGLTLVLILILPPAVGYVVLWLVLHLFRLIGIWVLRGFQ